MKGIKRFFAYFTAIELTLYLSSMALITLAFVIFDRVDYFKFISSLIGATALIFCAKGNPIGQAFVILFGTLYAIISYSYRYYGEMITYAGMTLPMAVIALISWLKNPFNGNKSEVAVNRIKGKEVVFMFILTAVVTTAFFFILRALNTTNLIPSTISIATSFVAVYLSGRRSAFFALAYALNDIILIVLWVMATVNDISYVSVVICFTTFLANDLYGFFNWLKMERRQRKATLKRDTE